MMAFKQRWMFIDVQFGKLHAQALRHVVDGFPCSLAQMASLADKQLNFMQSTHLFIISWALEGLKLGDVLHPGDP